MPVYTVVTANAKPAVLLNIYRQPDSNTVVVAEAVHSEIENIRKELPKGIDPPIVAIGVAVPSFTFTMNHMLDDGSQFAFSRLTPGSFVSWQYFYTSNLSVKKSLVQDWMTGGFDTGFPGAALEDMELAYRLWQSNQGLRLHYDPASTGLHHHPYTLGGFLDRQFFVGRSLRRMLDLHRELLDEYGLRNVDAALRRPAGPDDAEELRSAARSIAAIRAAARVLEAQSQLGFEDWHGTFLSHRKQQNGDIQKGRTPSKFYKACLT